MKKIAYLLLMFISTEFALAEEATKKMKVYKPNVPDTIKRDKNFKAALGNMQTCMEKWAALCSEEKDSADCRSKKFKQLEPQCQTLIKSNMNQMSDIGKSCMGIMKICPINMAGGDTTKMISDLQACIKKNMDKLPKDCKGLIDRYTGKK
ncbi:MAG: hypothetical protein ACPGJV_07545 [Bacteriovoracaceae bacterium]